MTNRLKLERELEAAVELALDAGKAVMEHYGRAAEEHKDGAGPVTAADRASDAIILAGLQARFPGDAFLSEESRDAAVRLNHDRVWIVDPLDGTREFIDGVPEFAVMIGLSYRGRAVLGVVYCPATDTLYAASEGQGAWVLEAGVRRALVARGAHPTLRLVGSRSHPDARLVAIQRELGITDVRPSGSVGVKCALIARGERDLYVHPVPYLKEWDTCAPEVILREAGGTVCDCICQPLRYNKPSPVQPNGILAAAPGVLPQVFELVRAIFTREAPAQAAS